MGEQRHLGRLQEDAKRQQRLKGIGSRTNNLQMSQEREGGKFALLGKIMERSQGGLGADDGDEEGLTVPGHAVQSGGCRGAEIRIRKRDVKGRER